jgi:hypothetical protein
MLRSGLAFLFALAAVAAPALGDDVDLFPDDTVRLQGARYAPTDVDLHWDGWIGAGVSFVRANRATFSFQGDVETIAGNTRRAFDAAQVNYHLEPSLRVDLGKAREVALFYHHVSRHEIDKTKPEAVDWNILGIRGSADLPRLPLRVMGSIGKVVQESLVGYEWEFVGRVEADALRRPWGAAYVVTLGRGVLTESSPAFPRDGFLDFLLEGGVRWQRQERTAQLWVAYEHRNDVLVARPGYMDRALFGFRLGLRSSTPAP